VTPATADQERQSESQQAVLQRFAEIRAASLALAKPLSEADCQVQSMSDASPTRWHLAHTTWFFETMVLERFEPGFRPHHPAFRMLFNSYYNGVGEAFPRHQRGLVTRPDLAAVKAYRAAVDERIAALLGRTVLEPEMASLLELGLQHEQQHQELILTDIKHLLSCNPLAPAYHEKWPLATVHPVSLHWLPQAGGLVEIGHSQGNGFAFDNEEPRHQVWLKPFGLANRLITHGEWADFVADGAYNDHRWWLSAGWEWLRSQRIQAPLYWRGSTQEGWRSFTLHGEVAIDPHTPITHINLYEADAYARWRSAQDQAQLRLPTEAEWEVVAQSLKRTSPVSGNFVETGALHPMPVAHALNGEPAQMLGDVWEWTSSSYQAYPGYQPWAGAVGEYNGKFMVNQTVLRGGSCATPRSHIRTSYRNFFPTDARWQFTGLRLACDATG
jgi:ergothioneine biosynthesis protein EgtB